jgi:aromatic-L-amino-acid decarboxylase
MNSKEFREYVHEFADWMADYFEQIEDYPVTPEVNPGDIYEQLPEKAPLRGEDMDKIMKDFISIIMPGMTHWQHPSFHAYFPANNSYPSVLAEMLTATLGAQCMMWQTSPSAAELEERVTDWLRDMLGLPGGFSGVIQDTASTATLVALLTAREKLNDYKINEQGFNHNQYRIYCSVEAHSSIEKAVKIAGFGRENLVKINVDNNFAMLPEALEAAVINDRENGLVPLFVIAALGTTGSTAVDSIKHLGKIARKNNLWLHVDAAYSGSAMILPEMRHYLEGVKMIDSFVFNPHKWLMTNFDCSAYFVKDKEALIRTFEIMPEYLKTEHDEHVNNYRDWGIQLGRRFRALKLWFVIRNYGVEGLQNKIRNDIELTKYAEKKLRENGMFDILAPVNFNVICFRYNPGLDDSDKLNVINQKLLNAINKDRKVFMTHTKLNGDFAIRLVAGQTHIEKRHIDKVLTVVFDAVKIIEDEK